MGKIISRGHGLENEEIKKYCYSDDTVLIAQNEDNLQRLFYRFLTWWKKVQHGDISSKKSMC